jgi:hypothetical protein
VRAEWRIVKQYKALRQAQWSLLPHFYHPQCGTTTGYYRTNRIKHDISNGTGSHFLFGHESCNLERIKEISSGFTLFMNYEVLGKAISSMRYEKVQMGRNQVPPVPLLLWVAGLKTHNSNGSKYKITSCKRCA